MILEFHSSEGPEVASLRLTHDSGTDETIAVVTENGRPLAGSGMYEFSADGTAVTLGWSDGPVVRDEGFNEVQVLITVEPGGEIFSLVLEDQT